MTYHFVNILTWKYFQENYSESRKIYIDGFLLKLAIYILSKKWIQKTSGINFYSGEKFRTSLFLTARKIKNLNCIVLPFWNSLEEVMVSQELSTAVVSSSEIIIGISSPKQDRLADLLQKSNQVKGNIYCLGAAIYTEPLIKSEYLIVTWFTMLFNAPKRTLKKLSSSIPAFFNAIVSQRKEFLQFINLLTNDRD